MGQRRAETERGRIAMVAAPRWPTKFREAHEAWVDVGYRPLAREDRRSAPVHLPTGIVASLCCVGLMIQKQTDGASIAVRHFVWWVHGRLQARHEQDGGDCKH